MAEQIPFQKIVVPLDGSPQAEMAIPHAEQIARGGGELMLLHVYHPAGKAYAPENALAGQRTQLEDARQHAIEYVKALRNSLGSQHINVSGHAVESTDFAQAVCDFVSEEGADVVVMPTRSHSRLVRVLMGDPASSVAGCVNACLLLVRGDQEAEWDAKSKKVLAAQPAKLLSELESLHKAGLLTTEEFEAKQALLQARQ